MTGHCPVGSDFWRLPIHTYCVPNSKIVLDVRQLGISREVLLLEDDLLDSERCLSSLEMMGFHVMRSQTIDYARKIFEEGRFSLIILHLSGMPMRSLDLCSYIRSLSAVPIIMLTSRDEEVTERMCLDAGADDYIVKPIDQKILTARVMQQLIRAYNLAGASPTTLTWECIHLDKNKLRVEVSEKEILLTKTEFSLLELLMNNPTHVLSREHILKSLGVGDGIGSRHILDTHISNLRKKVKLNGGPHIIEAVRGLGFRLASPTYYKDDKQLINR